MSYSNHEPDDPQHRFHTQPTAPYPQAAPPYTEPPGSYTERPGSYGERPGSYAQPPGSYSEPSGPYSQSAPPYTQSPAPYAQSPYAQPAAPYAQPAPPYAQPPAPYAQPAPPPYSAPPASPPRSQTDTATLVARFVVGLTGSVAFIFVLHIFFSLAKANQNNGFVEFVYVLAKVFVLGFGDVFTPNDAKIGLVLNYGLAALVYLVLGKVIARALRQ